MDKLMNVFSFLADDISQTVVSQAYTAFIGIVNIVLPILMSVLLVIGMFFGIQLGVKYAKAEEDDDKKKAKGQLINCIVGVLIAILFVAIIEIILNQDFVAQLFKKVSTSVGQAGEW